LKRDSGSCKPDYALVALVGAAAFFSGVVCLSFGFAYDDFWTILDNSYLRDPDALWGLVNGEASRSRVPDAGRPLMVVQHWVEWRFFGSRSPGYHLVSLLWHVVCSVLVYVVTLQLWKRQGLAIFAGVLFSFLPIHAEVVAVASFREDSMVCAFSLLCWYLLILSREKGGGGLLMVTGWLSFFLALASKEAAAVMVVVVPLCNGVAWRRSPIKEFWEGKSEYLGLACVLGLTLTFRVLILGGVNPYHGPVYQHAGDMWGASFFHRFLIAGHVFMQGVGQLFAFGWGQAPEYCEYPEKILSFWGGVGVVFSVALFLWSFWAAAKKKLPVLTAGLWFLMITFAPTSNIFWMPNIRADRFWYLPSVGFCMALAWVFLETGERIFARERFFFKQKNGNVFLVSLVIICFLFCAAQFIGLQRNLSTYKNDSTLWQKAARKAPCNHRALVGGAEVDLRIGRYERSERRLKRALDIRPGYPPAYQVLGRMRLKQERHQEAIKWFEKAIEGGYWRKGASYLGIGRSYLGLDKLREAEKAFIEALKHDPTDNVSSSVLLHLARFCGEEKKRESGTCRVGLFAEALGTAIWGKRGEPEEHPRN